MISLEITKLDKKTYVLFAYQTDAREYPVCIDTYETLKAAIIAAERLQAILSYEVALTIDS